MKFSTIILIIAIIIWGVLLGGIVYSHIVYFPVYLSNLPDSAVLVTGKYQLHEEKFWMGINPVLILLLIITLISNGKNKPRRKKILISFVVYAVVLIVSSIYFIPELIDQWQEEKKFTEFINYDKVKQYRNFGGIRIEEDFLITSSGCLLLGKPLAKTPAAIESLKARL